MGGLLHKPHCRSTLLTPTAQQQVQGSAGRRGWVRGGLGVVVSAVLGGGSPRMIPQEAERLRFLPLQEQLPVTATCLLLVVLVVLLVWGVGVEAPLWGGALQQQG